MNKLINQPFSLALNSILFITGIGLILMHKPVWCAVCFLLASLLFIWTFKSVPADTYTNAEELLDETDSLHIQLSLKIQELADSNKLLSEENEQLINELNLYKEERKKQPHPFYSCPLTSALPVNLHEFFSGYLKNHASLLDAGQYHIAYDCSIPDADTYLSSSALTIICNNILDNILKFSPNHTTIYLWITAIENITLIIFKNEGDGLNEEELDSIFDLNYQGSNKKTGTGLGLAQVKALLEDFGGTIYAKSTKHSGFTLYIQLPEQPLN